MQFVSLETRVLKPSGAIPNSRLPLVIYRSVALPELRTAEGCARLFSGNGWGGNWIDGVFDYWHFHTTGHEVLGCVAGQAVIGFGGADGIATTVTAGDVAVLPAGTGHRRLEASPDFTVVGGYPPGQSGRIVCPGDIPIGEAVLQIEELPLPDTDPLFGPGSTQIDCWRGQKRPSRQSAPFRNTRFPA